jgi:hypothetical protein
MTPLGHGSPAVAHSVDAAGPDVKQTATATTVDHLLIVARLPYNGDINASGAEQWQA